MDTNRAPILDLAVHELSASDRDDAAAMRQASALNASAAQANKLRTIIEERRDALALVEKYKAELHTSIVRANMLQTEQIRGGDSRLQNFWERAMEQANEENFCSEYDRMAEALDGPRRDSEYDVTVLVTVSVSMRVTAQSDEDACDTVGDWDEDTIRDHVYGLDRYNVNVASWEVDSAELA